MGNRVERAVSEAIKAGRDGKPADSRWKAAETLARSLARALDVAEQDKAVFATVQLAPRLLEVLQELRLTPTTGEITTDPMWELLRELSAPAVCDQA